MHNHASIIDGIRLCKAVRYHYNNNDMADLEQKLIEASPKDIALLLLMVFSLWIAISPNLTKFVIWPTNTMH